jgi:hypothetical protein
VYVSPYEVTATIVLPMKVGPPESPKHVPPVDELLEISMAKSPTFALLIWSKWGRATILSRSSSVNIASAGVSGGNERCSPYPTVVKVVRLPGFSESS